MTAVWRLPAGSPARYHRGVGVIKFESLQAGMVLAGPVLNHHGAVVLPAGSTVEEKHLRLLKLWGVAEVDVAGQEEPSAEKVEVDLRLDPALAGENDAVDERFRYVQDQELMMALKAEVKRHLLRRIAPGPR